MDPITISLLIALWGAALSTVLAVVKLWEIRRDRFRVDVGYNFSGAPNGANEVIVRNLGTRPFILGYWELLWLPHRWAPKHKARSISPEEDANDVRIEPGGSYTLTCRGPNHFDWHTDALRGRTIYLRLHVVGRRSILRKVYG